MALKKFNSVGGFSVGLPENIIDVVDDVGNVSANSLFVSNLANLGNISNVTILGGSANYLLKTDGTGNLSWTSSASIETAAGSNTEIQFNDDGVFGTDANFTYDKATQTLSVIGNISIDSKIVTTYVSSSTEPTNPRLGDQWYNQTNDITYQYIYDGVSHYWIDISSGYMTANVDAVGGTLVLRDLNANVYANGLFGNTLTITGTSYLGSDTNVNITGGTNGQYLRTDGSGNLTWADVPIEAGIANGTSNINAGVVDGNISVSIGGVSNTVIFTSTGVNVNGYIDAGTGNISSGNANLGNLVTANYFSGNGSYLTSITGANVTGYVANATHANVSDSANSVAGSNVVGQVGNALVAGTVYEAVQSNITSVGTLTSLSVSGNITSGNAILGNLATANYFSGTLTTQAQPNITSTGTLSSLDITGNVSSGGNIIGNGQYLTNLTGGNVTGQVGNALVSGTVYSNAQPNITSVGTLTSVDVSGNISAGNITSGNITLNSLGTGQIAISSSGLLVGGPDLIWEFNNAALWTTRIKSNGYITTTGNVTSGNAILGNLATANYFSGTLTTQAQPNITSLGTLSSLDVTANVLAGNIRSDHLLYANGTPYVFTTNAAGSNTQIQFNSSNAFAGSANLTFDTITKTITSDNLQLTGNLAVGGLANLGATGNITMLGGMPGYVLTTDGAGNLSWGVSGGGGGTNGLVSIAKDRFLTTGSSNTFSLSTTPSSQNAIEVVIDGLQQISNTYSLSGTTLSFPTNPAAGQIIEVTTFGVVGATGNVGEVYFNDGSGFGTSNAMTFNSGTNTLSVTNLTTTGNLTSQNGFIYVDTALIAVSSGNAGIFNTSVSNINLGLTANVTIGSTTGNTVIRGNLSANSMTINSLSVGDYYSSRDAVNVSTDTIIDQFPVNIYRSAKYTMRVNSDDGFQAVEVLLVHNNSSSYVTIYGSISSSGSDIISLSSNIGSGNVRLFASTLSANTNVKILGTYVPD